VPSAVTSPAPQRRAESAGILPLGYLVGFFELLAAHRDLIEIITYDDLQWGDDYDYERGYPGELERWRQRMKGPGARQRIYLILQHDVDAHPGRTMQVLHHEQRCGLRSNVMIFRRRHDRQRLATTGELRYVDYGLDVEGLKRFEREHGFVVGYHCNAVEQAGWDLTRARRRFRDDVRELRRNFNIRFFSPHGGVPGPDGRNNHSLRLATRTARRVRWVANRHGIKLSGRYSDGGIRNPARDMAGRDLRDFVRSWRRGRRYRVLTHPQYYHDVARPLHELMGAAWYRELFDDLDRSPSSYWEDVVPGSMAEPAA
jgi:hypothetical protein